jgi:hypothetical protein
MVGWIVAGGIVALLGAFVRSRVTRYQRLFSPEHLLEVARSVGRLKAAAIEKMVTEADPGPEALDDPRILATSAGLVVLYTVREQEPEFLHHCSISIGGGHTPHAVGRTFMALIVNLVGLPLDKTRFMRGRSSVHHAEVALSAAEHTALAARPVEDRAASDIGEVQRAVTETMRQMTWGPLPTEAAGS